MVSCPYSKFNGVGFGVTVFAHTTDGQTFHKYRYGTGTHLIGNVYTQKYHDLRTRQLVAFLKKSVSKYKTVAKKSKQKTANLVQAAGRRIQPVQQWSAVLRDESLRDVLEKDVWVRFSKGVFTKARYLERLWKKWRPDEKFPDIDLVKNIAVVVTSTSGNPVTAVPVIDKKGNLQIYSWSRVTTNSGFGYQIAVIPRKGIKTVNEVRVACGRYNCGCEQTSYFNPVRFETKALYEKIYRGNCWGQLAEYEVFRDDKALHKRILDAAYKDCAKTNKILLYIANTGG